ncbi:MAG: hypothetical protein ABTA16_00330 [Niallia sp.]
MKKLLSIILVGSILLSACGNNNDDDIPEPGDPDFIGPLEQSDQDATK